MATQIDPTNPAKPLVSPDELRKIYVDGTRTSLESIENITPAQVELAMKYVEAPDSPGLLAVFEAGVKAARE